MASPIAGHGATQDLVWSIDDAISPAPLAQSERVTRQVSARRRDPAESHGTDVASGNRRNGLPAAATMLAGEPLPTGSVPIPPAIEIGPAQCPNSRALYGRIEQVSRTEIRGWAWDPRAPDEHIRIEMVEGEKRLMVVVADGYRPDLARLGCGDGRHGFRIELDGRLLSNDRHVLTLRCADTGATMPGSPILAECTTSNHATPPIDVGHATPACPVTPDNNPTADAASWLMPTEASAKYRSAVHKLRAGHGIRYIVSRSDVARYRLMRCFATEGVTASVLSVTDCVRETATLPSRFFTDSMIAVWLLREDVQQRFQRLDEEVCQYAFLAWYLCVRPIDEGLALSREPTGPILAALSEVVVADGPEFATGCTALMVAAYCYVSSYNGSGMLAPQQCRADDIVVWFLCQGAYHLRVSHAIPQNVRINLAAPRLNRVSPILEWAAAGRMPLFEPANVVNKAGQAGILGWLDAHDHELVASWRDLLRESLIVRGRAQFDDPPRPFLPAVCGRLRNVTPDMTDLLLTDGQAEYMGIGGNGERLLLKEEWYWPDPVFVWSRSPISTVLFRIAGDPVEWLRIGLEFYRGPGAERSIRVILNHNPLWSGTIDEASSAELILACRGRCLVHDTPNLLQIEIDEAFVPAEHSQSSDSRRLGVGLKRFWIQRGGGLI